jgi:phosphoribosylaminoimidazolecarboxamide formyltransferase/IMP cyclohydrolase
MTSPVRRALISMFDKTGVADFAAALVDMGVEIISSGGTARTLADAGVPVRQLQEWTGFPEMLGHRVVTLHPKVHGGILALRDDPDHQADMAKYDIEPVDLVCVSLYPFEQAIAAEDCTPEQAIEMIDIGGPTMVRAAAKNHRFVTVVTDRGQYAAVLEDMRAHDGCVSDATRARLALEAFSLTAHYDSAISAYLADRAGDEFPDRLTLSYTKVHTTRYGENPHQAGAFYQSASRGEACVGAAKLLGGREISYNNYFDANGAFELVKDFAEPTVAIIKHANPAGCSIGDDLVEAYHRAYLGDVNAAMGGIVAVNRPVTVELAEAIVTSYNRWGKDAGAGGFFAEVIIAPSFEPGATDAIIEGKAWGKNVRILETGPITGARNREKYFKYVVGGMLLQNRDLTALNEDDWSCVTRRKPTDTEMADLRFAWVICKHVKSNAIVLAKDQTLLGAGAGQMSRVNSARMAVHLANQYGGSGSVDLAGSAVASDAFFPFPDGLDVAAEVGATAVIQPGGAKKDEDVIARADELGLAMIFTGTRHFNH